MSRTSAKEPASLLGAGSLLIGAAMTTAPAVSATTAVGDHVRGSFCTILDHGSWCPRWVEASGGPAPVVT